MIATQIKLTSGIRDYKQAAYISYIISNGDNTTGSHTIIVKT